MVISTNRLPKISTIARECLVQKREITTKTNINKVTDDSYDSTYDYYIEADNEINDYTSNVKYKDRVLPLLKSNFRFPEFEEDKRDDTLRQDRMHQKINERFLNIQKVVLLILDYNRKSFFWMGKRL